MVYLWYTSHQLWLSVNSIFGLCGKLSFHPANQFFQPQPKLDMYHENNVFLRLPGTRGWYFVQNLLPDLFFPSFQKTSSSNQDLFVLIYSLEGKSGRIAGAHFSEYKTSNLKKGWKWKVVLPIRIILSFSILRELRVGASGRTQDHSLGLVIHLAREKLGH